MISARRYYLLGLLMLATSAQLAIGDEGDRCQVTVNIPGICRASSACENIEGYLRAGEISTSQVPSCGFGSREEIICCPNVPCCSTDRVVEVQDFVATSSERSRLPEPEPLPPTTTERKRIRESRLDESQNFFDFNKLLSTTAKPQKTHEPLKVPTHESMKMPSSETMTMPTHESMKWPTHESMKMPTQSVGAWGFAPPKTTPRTNAHRSRMEPQWGWDNREPRIVNQPLTTPRTRPTPQQPNPNPNSNSNLIHLVNDRLRQQGMQIEPAREVPMETQVVPTPTKFMDPFEPYRFRGQDRDKQPQPEPWKEPSNDLDDGPSPTTITPAVTRFV